MLPEILPTSRLYAHTHWAKEKKKKKKELNNLIRGAFGSTWGHNYFYMGTQNGSKLEI